MPEPAIHESSTRLAVPGVDKRPALIIMAYCTCGFIWGTTWYGIRACILPGGYSAYIAAALRFTIAAAILAVICFFWRHTIRKVSLREFAGISAAGLLSGLAFGLLYVAEQSVTGGVAAVISSTSPLMAALLAMATRTERLSRFTIVGFMISLAGTALVFHDRLQVSKEEAAAIGILLITSFLYASSNVMMKRHAHHASPLATNSIFFLTASSLLWSAAALSGNCSVPSPLPVEPTLALVYLAVFGTLVTFAAFFYLLKHVRLSTATTLGFVTPIIALIVDALLEKHGVLSAGTYCGIAVVMAGLALSFLRGSASNQSKSRKAV